ncbi:hypothetical protein FBU30_003346 [Linnemannia zychae]|nr:hypothetical protein FBU30_003346 [Linnemannia zychae]
MASGNLEQTLTSFLPPNLSTDGLFSSLRHGSRQRPIAWSRKNMAILPSWVPDRKTPGLMKFLSMLLTEEDRARLWDTAIEDISSYHDQSNITHLLWNHAGNHFVSIDEKGKIVIWANKYIAKQDSLTNTTKFERERTGRARGPLSFVILSSDGQLTTLFKQAGQYFTHISTVLPQQSANEDITASRISHGSMISGVNGIHLVTHCNGTLPSTVNLYHIELRFTPEQIFRCDALAVLHLSNPLATPGSVMMPNVVQHLQLLPSTSSRPLAVAVALGHSEGLASGESSYKSQIVVWEITSKVLGFHPAFQELSTRRNEAVSGQPSLTFTLLGERQFKEKFISTLSYVPRSREILVGFSNGELLGLESRFPGLSDSITTFSDGFRREEDGCPLVAVRPSPNGYYLICLSLNGHISSVFTTETSEYELEIEPIIQQAVLAILNEWDYTDIVSIVAKASRVSNDHQLPDRFIEGVFKCYDFINGAEDSSVLEPFLPRASVLRRMLSLQLVLFQTLPGKLVQYRATSALLQLQSIAEVFLGCCTSDAATVAAHMEQGSNVAAGLKPLAFNTDALWSLFPLCGWVLDFCTILFRELAIFINRKTKQIQLSHGIAGGYSPVASTSNPRTSTAVPSLLCFLYHGRAKRTLRTVLIILEQYYAYIRVRDQLYANVIQSAGPIEPPTVPGQEKVSNHTNSMSIIEAVAMKNIHIVTLSSHVEAMFTRCPVKVATLKLMLRDLSGIGRHVDIGRPNGVNGALHRVGENGALDKSASDHIIFIKGVVPSTSSAQLTQAKIELKMIAKRYPTVWDMNRLMFATIHWLDIEPARTLYFSKTGSGERTISMHPSRCRIDPALALKPRFMSAINASPNLDRQHLPLFQHHSSNLSTMSTGSRGSISGPAGRTGPIPMRTIIESPGDVSMFQPPIDPALRTPGPSFAEGSSTMTAAGSAHNGGSLDTISPPALGPRTIWGLTHEERDDGTEGRQPIDSQEEDLATYKSIWNNWNLALQGQLRQQSSFKESQQHSQLSDAAPDSDALLEDDGDEEDEEGDSEEEMREYKNPAHRQNGGNNSRRSSLATLTPLSLWLLQESKSISKKTRSEWTALPILADEGSDPYSIRSEITGRWVLHGLEKRFEPTSPTLSDNGEPSQAEIEAQVRKRRFGVDPIRKAKKYKSSGRSRQCIRCHQISTNTSANAKPSPRRPTLPAGMTSGPNNNNIIPDIAASTLWYHNYDRSCICGGMWLEV